MITAILSVISCKSPTESFDRDNKFDPHLDTFDASETGGLSLSYNEQGIINITWPDTIEVIDGYTIEKSVTLPISYKKIGKVPADSTRFVDSSKTVGPYTFYRVMGFIERSGERVLYNQFSGKLDLGGLANLSILYDASTRSADLKWEDRSPFETEFQILRMFEGEESFSEIARLDKNTTGYQDKLGEIDFSDRFYRVNMLLSGEGFEQAIDTVENLFDPSTFMAPENLSIEFVDEEHIRLTWDDNCFFEEGFRIHRVDPENLLNTELIATVDPNVTSYGHRLSLENNKLYRFKITAFKGTTESLFDVINPVRFEIPTPQLINDRYTNTVSSTIKLSWDISDDRLVNKFILEKKLTGETDWTPLEEFDKSIRNYTDSGVDPSNSYQYRVRTLSSDYSDELELFYGTLFDKIFTYDAYSRTAAPVSMSPDGRYIALPYYSDKKIKLLDIDSKSIHTVIRSDTANFLHAQFNIDGTLLAGTGATDEYQSLAYIFTVPSGNTLNGFRLDGLRADHAIFSPDSRYLYTSNRHRDITEIEISTGNKNLIYQEHTSTLWTSQMAISPDGSLLAINDENPTVIDLTADPSVVQLAGSDWIHPYYNKPDFSADGSKIAIIFLNDLQVYETGSWSIMNSSESPVIFNPHFHPLDSNIIIASGDNSIHFRNIDTGAILKSIKTGDSIFSMEVSDDGKRIVAGLDNGSLEVWEDSGQKGWKELN